jgi:hypothetical protein
LFQPPRLNRRCTCTSKPFAIQKVQPQSILTQTCRRENQSTLSNLRTCLTPNEMILDKCPLKGPGPGLSMVNITSRSYSSVRSLQGETSPCQRPLQVQGLCHWGRPRRASDGTKDFLSGRKRDLLPGGVRYYYRPQQCPGQGYNIWATPSHFVRLFRNLKSRRARVLG